MDCRGERRVDISEVLGIFNFGLGLKHWPWYTGGSTAIVGMKMVWHYRGDGAC